jgi:hypothetical protein
MPTAPTLKALCEILHANPAVWILNEPGTAAGVAKIAAGPDRSSLSQSDAAEGRERQHRGRIGWTAEPGDQTAGRRCRSSPAATCLSKACTAESNTDKPSAPEPQTTQQPEPKQLPCLHHPADTALRARRRVQALSRIPMWVKGGASGRAGERSR